MEESAISLAVKVSLWKPNGGNFSSVWKSKMKNIKFMRKKILETEVWHFKPAIKSVPADMKDHIPHSAARS